MPASSRSSKSPAKSKPAKPATKKAAPKPAPKAKAAPRSTRAAAKPAAKAKPAAPAPRKPAARTTASRAKPAPAAKSRTKPAAAKAKPAAPRTPARAVAAAPAPAPAIAPPPPRAPDFETESPIAPLIPARPHQSPLTDESRRDDRGWQSGRPFNGPHQQQRQGGGGGRGAGHHDRPRGGGQPPHRGQGPHGQQQQQQRPFNDRPRGHQGGQLSQPPRYDDRRSSQPQQPPRPDGRGQHQQPSRHDRPAPQPFNRPPAPPQHQPPRYQGPSHPPQDRPPQPQQHAPRPSEPPVAPAAAPAEPVLAPREHHHAPPAGPDHPGRDEIFERGKKFSELGLRESVLKGITEAGFEYPTAIQARLIPTILAGKDVLGQAKTGTGKTAAFGLPLLSHIEPDGGPFQALVLVPTRELAIQVATDLKELGRFTGLNILPVYGGQNVKTQASLLSRGPQIIVATPGRVMDMQQRGFINYRNIKAVVLDEVDRMLDIGFRDDIRRILGGCPRERQTIFVSATINSDIEALARSFARECEKIVASAGSLTVSMVKQWHLPVQPWDKKQLLLHLLTHEEPALTVVFCRTKKTVDNIGEYLVRKGVDCHAIHGDMYQNKRNKVIEQLKAGKLEVLVASDVASRGLDVEGITHVINYDLPEDPDLYVHRIGRTARAGRDGVAWSLVTPEQGSLLTQIELLINAEIPKLDYPDFKPGPLPPDVLARQQQDARRIETRGQFNRFSSTPAPGAPPASAPSGTRQTDYPAGSSGAAAPVAPRPAAAPLPPDLNRFPGGIVPTMAPPKRMFGKVKTARSMRQAGPQPAPQQQQQQQPAQPAAPAVPAEGTPPAA